MYLPGYHRVEMLLAELEQVQQLLLSFICVYRWCCHQMVKPGPTSGPTVGNSLTNHASSSTAARTYGINFGQYSSSFSCNQQRDPPVSFKVVERIRRWEFVELANLLITQDIKSEEYSFIVDSDQPGYRAPSQGKGKLPVIDNIMTWLTAFSRFMAVILSTEATSREEAAGLAAHQHVILQLYDDLGGNHWLKYDTEYREWVAAKGIRIWGSLTLPHMAAVYLKHNLYKCQACLM